MNRRLASELHNASFRLRGLSDGQQYITFIDPFTDEQLSPSRAPASIEAQPHLKVGLDYLRSRNNDMTLSIYGSPHGNEAVHDMRELMNAFGIHDVIFLEGIGHSAHLRDVAWDVSAGSKTKLTGDEAKLFGPYGQRKLAALLQQNKPVFFADVPSDGGDFEQAFLEWDGMIDVIKGMIDESQDTSEGLNLAMGIILTATTILREWYMLATMGCELKRLEDAGYKSSNPMFLVGVAHGETLPAKASVLGLSTSVILPRMVESGENWTVNIPFKFALAVGACAVKTEF